MDSWRKGLLWAVIPVVLVGCGDLFDVSNPTNIIDEELNDPLMITALANAPEAAFGEAYDDMILDAALPTDEGTHHSTRTSRIELMTGVFLAWNEQYDASYDQLARARWVSDDVTARLEELLDSPGSDSRVAHAYYWAGMSLQLLAEYFEEVPLDGGAPNAPDAVMDLALDRFTQAASVAQAAGNQNLRAAILGSRARALRALYFERGQDQTYFDQAAQAAEAALAVSPTFRLDVRYQLPGSQNAVFARASTGALYDGMHPRFAGRVDPVSGNPDPRIAHTEQIGTDPYGHAIHEPLKYSSRNDDIPASRWQEAELILAEYEFRYGTLADAVTHINRVRSAVGLPDFDSADPDEVWAQIQYERETEFWLEGRRMQDMRYWGIIPEDWIPESQNAGWRKWPVSQQERDANPNYN